MPRVGINTRIGIPFKSGSRSWTQRWSTADEVLFFAETKNIADGKLYNQKEDATDYLTVAGAAGSYTFQAPNTAPYIAADTDYIWFKTDETPRTTTEAELIGYDLQRTPVKYDDDSPNSIRAIMILSSAVTGTLLNTMHKDFRLPLFWSGVENIYGYIKSNRGLVQQLWTPESVIPTDLAVTWVNDYAHITFTDNSGGLAQTEVYESVNGGASALVTTLGVGIELYDYTARQNATLAYKVRSLLGGNYSDFTAEVVVNSPLVFRTNQSTLTQVSFGNIAITAGKAVTVNWGDGSTNTLTSALTHDYAATQNPYYIQLSGDLNELTELNHILQPKSYGNLSKWIVPSKLIILRLRDNNFTGDLSSWSIPSSMTKFNGQGIYLNAPNAFSAPPRGNLLGLDSSDGIYMFRNVCNTASLDAWFAWANTFYATNTPVKSVLFEFTGEEAGIPTGGNSNTNIVGIKEKFVAAGYVATINVRTV